MQQRSPTARVRRWTMDAHRLGLLPIRKRIWAPKGCRPQLPVRRRYQWLSGYGFVRPETGQTWWCLLPTVRLAAFALAVATFARDEGIDEAHPVVLVLDRAGWHTSPHPVLPPGRHLVFLPPYSPDLATAERLGGWSLPWWPTAPSPVWMNSKPCWCPAASR